MPLNEKEILMQFGLQLQKEFVEKSIALGQKASGRTYEALNVESSFTSMIFSGPAHVQVLEDGRSPGKMPPVDAIKQWILDKNIQFEGSLDSVSFLIRRKIAQSGTDLFMKGGRSGVISNVILEDRIQALLQTFGNKNSELIKSDIIEQYKDVSINK